MKKITTIFVLAGITFNSFATDPVTQNTSSLQSSGGGEKCFDDATHIINLGFGFGSLSHQAIYSGVGYDHGITPAFSLSYEQPWPKKLGPGYLGVGAYVGYQHEHFDYDYNYYYSNNYYYHHSWNYYMVAARAAYHWDVLNSKNAEVYAGVIIGARFQTENYQTNDPNNNDPYSYHESVAYPAYSVFAGARWYFVKKVALFGEVGYGISYLTGGVSFKF
ncbi:MAG: hypothetical protein ACXVPU_04900 [Bacteroidia bacterium]